jgi:ectoine hydroxylase-related dioxygenase (phytanoyl-CoA dioxygenase family)
MQTFEATNIDQDAVLGHLMEHGYVVVENMLVGDEFEEIRDAVAKQFAKEQEQPYEPGDGPETDQDEELRQYFQDSYTISEAELDRLLRRIRHTRAENMDAPWPVKPSEMNKSFLHLPTLFDYDESPRIWNIPAKLKQTPKLIEHPIMLGLMRATLGQDCTVSDISATSLGPHTEVGGAWHIDAPLTQMPGPLPDIPLTVQNAWMLDDFTLENGATRVLPKSHLLRKKPTWGYHSEEGEVILTAPAGSMAMWLSQTWHKSGPNTTDHPRRAILGYFCRSWIKPFSDYTRAVPREIMETYSPTARYLLGWSAFGPKRG